MDIKILKNKKALAKKVAREIEDVITRKPNALICLCAGDSPVPIMKRIVLDTGKKRFPAGAFKFVSLDEWVGLGIDDAGSCIHDVTKYFFNPMGMEKGERIFFFDGLAANLEGECKAAEDFIEKNGGIDVVLLGIGMNGHIGFNEPPTKETDGVRVVALSETSKTVGTKYFNRQHELKRGITIGIPQIMGAKKIIVIAYGAHKQSVVCDTLRLEKSGEYPVTLIREHQNITFYFDKEAAHTFWAGKCK